jgi:hypothetical protein
LGRRIPSAVPRGNFRRLKNYRHELGEIFMFRENRTRALIEKIDDAIEQAEDLGLAFVAGILMMARLEAVQMEVVTFAGRGSDE